MFRAIFDRLLEFADCYETPHFPGRSHHSAWERGGSVVIDIDCPGRCFHVPFGHGFKSTGWFDPLPSFAFLKAVVTVPSPLPPHSTFVHLPDLPPIQCPCGEARRAFADQDEFPGTVHLTKITQDAQTHYHREHTEVYVVIECETDAIIELDGQSHPVAPMNAILIPPRVRHRAIGNMTVLIICTPHFDPRDEYFD